MSDDHWSPRFVLPNLSVEKPIGTNHMAVAAASDPRVRAFAKRRPDFVKFVKRFTDAFRVPVNAAILIRRDDAPATYHSIEAAAAFRNIIALAIVPYGRAVLTLSPRSHGIFWGDTFAFHPWMLSSAAGTVVCQSSAMLGIHEVDAFHGQSSPTVPPLTASPGVIDQPLLDELLRRWELAYGREVVPHEEVRLFRSLNMAYNGSLIPVASREATIFDVGRLLSLWVSAFEILAHPGSEGKVTRDSVLDQLDRQPVWVCEQLRDLAISISRTRPKKGDMPVLRKLPAWFYIRLYEARNDFLHGNPVTSASHLIEPHGAKSLLDVAAPLYRFALSSALGIIAPPIPDGKEFNTPEHAEAIVRRSKFLNYQATYEDALIHALSDSAYKEFFRIDRPIDKVLHANRVK